MKIDIIKINERIATINERPVEVKTKNNKYPIALATVALLALNVVAVSSVHAASDAYDFKVIAKLGDPAPGGGVHEGDFETQDINASETVLFASDLDVGGEGLFISKNGVNTQIMRSGDPAPGTGYNFGGFGIYSPNSINDNGDIAFGFGLDLPSPDNTTGFGYNAGVWRYDSSKKKLSKVFAAGDILPDGTNIYGTGYNTGINNPGMVLATVIIGTSKGKCSDNDICAGLGRGIFLADKKNQIKKVVVPGDPAPGVDKEFDDAWDANLNDIGDVAFGAHVKGEDCLGGPLGCFTSLYVYDGKKGKITSIAHAGESAPRGGTFREVFEGQINNNGDIAYIGDLAKGAEDAESLGVYLTPRRSRSIAVARPGDPLPGGTLLKASFYQGNLSINNKGDVAFSAQLQEDSNSDGHSDSGVYLYHKGKITSVVRTGDVIPGLGTVLATNNNYYYGYYDVYFNNGLAPGVFLNNRGEILTQVLIDDGVCTNSIPPVLTCPNYVITARPR